MSDFLRLDKYLADLGVGTRTQVKQMIRKSQVSVNGETVKIPEQKVNVSQDQVAVQGKILNYIKNKYFLLHKPSGYVSATEDSREKTVLSLLPEELRKGLFPVGDWTKIRKGCCCLLTTGICPTASCLLKNMWTRHIMPEWKGKFHRRIRKPLPRELILEMRN